MWKFWWKIFWINFSVYLSFTTIRIVSWKWRVIMRKFWWNYIGLFDFHVAQISWQPRNERKLKIQTARQKKNAWAGRKIIICNKFKNINSWFLEYFTNFITTWQQDTILKFRYHAETGALHNWPGKPGCDYTNKIRILKTAPMDKKKCCVRPTEDENLC